MVNQITGQHSPISLPEKKKKAFCKPAGICNMYTICMQ